MLCSMVEVFLFELEIKYPVVLAKKHGRVHNFGYLYLKVKRFAHFYLALVLVSSHVT